MTDEISTGPGGLSEAEAAARLRAEGHNELPRGGERNLLRMALDVCREPMLQLLLAAGAIYLVLGDLGEALVLLASAMITIAISIVQERRTENVLEALRDLTSPRALVIRGGERKRIPGRDVVRGDLLVLGEGDRVAADAVLLSATALEIDESLLTGESVPVRKRACSGPSPPAQPGGDDLPFVFSATLAVRGHGLGEVIATGALSEVGKIGAALQSIAAEPTPLHAQIRRIVRVVAMIAIGLCLVVALLYGLMRGSWLDAGLAGITLAMSMLPEEFPLVLTVFLVMGAWRISQARVLTRRAAAIETLGAATVLCTDKTGTLTMNRMSIAALEVGGHSWSTEEKELPETFHRLVEFGVLASAAQALDPMDKALHELAGKHLAQSEHLHGKWVLAREYPLAPELLAMSQVWTAPDQETQIVAAKGSPEAIVDLCHLDEPRRDAAQAAARRLAERGMRVLGVACGTFRPTSSGAWPDSQHDFDVEFLGLVGFADPLRPGVAEAVALCHGAGIKVAMITGDYPATARALAQAAGLDVGGGVLSGEEIAGMADDELRRRVAAARVFARIMPAQKLRIVEAFKANGEIVAMTGDGVNDAPALKAAHIGIAMGGRGTDVAREAAALVLLDDDFGSIVTAIRLGRRIYDNLQKAMSYIFAVHVPIAGLALLPLLFGWPLVFAPVHIAFLELVIDPVCTIVFEAESEEAGLMRRRPRDPRGPLFSWRQIVWSLCQGGLVLAVVIALFAGALDHGLPEPEARALAFTALVLCNFALILLDRSAGTSLRAALTRPNPALWRVLAVASTLLALAVYVPPIRELFHFGAMHADDVAAAFAAATLVLILSEGAKLARRRFG